MIEITTDSKVGEHILVDGFEYVTEEYDSNCRECAFYNSEKCSSVPCTGVILKKVKKEPKHRPYKDTEEMIADWKERFMVDEIPDFCMPMIWVKEKPKLVDVSEGTCLITEFGVKVVCLSALVVCLESLFDRYTYLDGSPCGKVEE